MRTLNDWFSEYGESHQNGTNKSIHFICVPAIYFSIVGLLASIPAGSLKAIAPFMDYALLIIAIAMLFYLRLSLVMFIAMLSFSLFCWWANLWIAGLGFMPLWLFSIIIFAVAWVGQFYGHKLEGKKPSFFKDIQFLLIGPAWVMGFLFRKMGINY